MELDLKNIQWGEFVIGKIFKVSRGKRLIESNREKGNVAYYSASSSNNGLTDFIKNPLFLERDCLVITTFCDSYFIRGEFTASDEISILKSQLINEYSGKFISKVIVSNREKFAFGYKAFTERIKRQKILLPINKKGEPDYIFMEKYMREKEKEKIEKSQNYITKKIELVKGFKDVEPLNKKEWGEFFIEDIAQIISGRDIYESERKKGNVPYVSATANNNGIGYFVGNDNETLEENCLSVNRNGSVGYSFYHPYKALFSNDCRKLRLKNKSPFVGKFVSRIITGQKDKYGYGYKMGTARIKRQKILLPINSIGQPDYEYMENYIKKLEYDKLTKYLKLKQ